MCVRDVLQSLQRRRDLGVWFSHYMDRSIVTITRGRHMLCVVFHVDGDYIRDLRVDGVPQLQLRVDLFESWLGCLVYGLVIGRIQTAT